MAVLTGSPNHRPREFGEGNEHLNRKQNDLSNVCGLKLKIKKKHFNQLKILEILTKHQVQLTTGCGVHKDGEKNSIIPKSQSVIHPVRQMQ